MTRAPSAGPRQPTPNLRRVLRVYAGTFDGANRVAVAAHSWKEAGAAFRFAGVNVSDNAARVYGSITSNPECVAAAVAAFPRVVSQGEHPRKEWLPL